MKELIVFVESHPEIFLNLLSQQYPLPPNLLDRHRFSLDWHLVIKNSTLNWNAGLLREYRCHLHFESLASAGFVVLDPEILSIYRNQQATPRALTYHLAEVDSLDQLELSPEDWFFLSKNPNIAWTEESLEKHAAEVDWKELSEHAIFPISWAFFQRHREKLNLRKLVANPKLTFDEQTLEYIVEQAPERVVKQGSLSFLSALWSTKPELVEDWFPWKWMGGEQVWGPISEEFIDKIILEAGWFFPARFDVQRFKGFRWTAARKQEWNEQFARQLKEEPQFWKRPMESTGANFPFSSENLLALLATPIETLRYFAKGLARNEHIEWTAELFLAVSGLLMGTEGERGWFFQLGTNPGLYQKAIAPYLTDDRVVELFERTLPWPDQLLQLEVPRDAISLELSGDQLSAPLDLGKLIDASEPIEFKYVGTGKELAEQGYPFGHYRKLPAEVRPRGWNATVLCSGPFRKVLSAYPMGPHLWKEVQIQSAEGINWTYHLLCCFASGEHDFRRNWDFSRMEFKLKTGFWEEDTVTYFGVGEIASLADLEERGELAKREYPDAELVSIEPVVTYYFHDHAVCTHYASLFIHESVARSLAKIDASLSASYGNDQVFVPQLEMPENEKQLEEIRNRLAQTLGKAPEEKELNTLTEGQQLALEAELEKRTELAKAEELLDQIGELAKLRSHPDMPDFLAQLDQVEQQLKLSFPAIYRDFLSFMSASNFDAQQLKDMHEVWWKGDELTTQKGKDFPIPSMDFLDPKEALVAARERLLQSGCAPEFVPISQYPFVDEETGELIDYEFYLLKTDSDQKLGTRLYQFNCFSKELKDTGWELTDLFGATEKLWELLKDENRHGVIYPMYIKLAIARGLLTQEYKEFEVHPYLYPLEFFYESFPELVKAMVIGKDGGGNYIGFMLRSMNSYRLDHELHAFDHDPFGHYSLFEAAALIELK